jgi:hypothetical protein
MRGFPGRYVHFKGGDEILLGRRRGGEVIISRRAHVTAVYGKSMMFVRCSRRCDARTCRYAR